MKSKLAFVRQPDSIPRKTAFSLRCFAAILLRLPPETEVHGTPLQGSEHNRIRFQTVHKSNLAGRSFCLEVMPIPCPHFKITIVKRSQGQSAVAGAAYQSGERLFSEYGLKRERTEQQMRDAIAKGTLMKDLQWVPVKKDDLFFIEAGTIHAIGAGALVAEIQENSNLTYRLYDYNRVGKDGKKRELHIDKALDVANLKGSAEPKQPLRVLKYRQGIASELLTRCKYFEVYRMIVNTERRQKVHYRADEIAFRVLLCVNGCGTISYEGGTIPFYKGDCIFVPADSEVLTIHGQAQFLDVRG